MLIASYVTLSVGGLLLLTGTGSVLGGNNKKQSEEEAEPDPTATEPDSGSGEGLRGAGYGQLALGLAGVVTGVTLLAVGFQRRKKAQNGTLVAATPVFGPGFTGASLRVRF